MSRRSTALPYTGLYSFTCDSCWGGFNTYGDSWATAEAEAMRDGWRFVGRGMGRRDYCGRCSP